MARIKKTIVAGKVVYPATIIQAIKDPETGKGLKEILRELDPENKRPRITNPSCSVKLAGEGIHEVGTKLAVAQLTYSASFNPGKYEYGPATGIVPSSWVITDSMGHTSQLASDSLIKELTVEENTNYYVTAQASYNESSAIPVTSKGDKCDELKIKAGTVKGQPTSIKGCRFFYSGSKEKKVLLEEITSAYIKGLAPTIKRRFELNVPAGALRVYLAFPKGKGYELTEALDGGDNWFNVADSFKMNSKEVSIGGVNDYKPIPYQVYWLNFAWPLTEARTFKIQI